MNLAQIVTKVAEALGDDRAARWLGSFNYDLGGRPIVLCETPGGRDKVAEYVKADPSAWWSTNAEPERT